MLSNILTVLEYYIDWVESAHFAVKYSTHNAIGISILDLCGSIVVCYNYRNSLKIKKSWFEVFIACLLMQFGGTTLTNSFLLGQTPSWIMSFTAFPAYVLAYWLTFHCPMDIYWKGLDVISSFSRINLIHLAQVGAAISSGHAVTSWGVDKALFNTFHVNSSRIAQSTLTCVLAGCLSGCGGGLLADVLGFAGTPSFTMIKTTEFFNPTNFAVSATATRAMILAVLYYALVTPHFMPWNSPACNNIYESHVCDIHSSSLLSKRQGHMVIVLLQIANMCIKNAFDIEVSSILLKFFLSCLNVSAVFDPTINTTSEIAHDASKKSKPVTMQQSATPRRRSKGLHGASPASVKQKNA